MNIHETIKVRVDFGKGIKRKYRLLENPDESKDKPHNWIIEFCHPKFGEVMEARRIFRKD